jgi:hypothetical protein
MPNHRFILARRLEMDSFEIRRFVEKWHANA